MIQEVSKTGKIECRYWDFRMSSDTMRMRHLAGPDRQFLAEAEIGTVGKPFCGPE